MVGRFDFFKCIDQQYGHMYLNEVCSHSAQNPTPDGQGPQGKIRRERETKFELTDTGRKLLSRTPGGLALTAAIEKRALIRLKGPSTAADSIFH